MQVYTAPARTFTNPLLEYGPDPWAICHNGFYYYLHSTRTDVTIWKTRDLTQLEQAQPVVVWTAPGTGPYSTNVWSPELHFLRGRWYIYFSAEDERGSNDCRRMWVLENPAPDPLDGQWTLKGEVATPDNRWAIDGTAFDVNGQLYFTWSGWAGVDNVQQSIYLCRMANPWTCLGERVLLSEPTLPWERHNYDPNPADPRNFVFVNEAPSLLIRNDRVFLVYSANGCWTDQYCLAMLWAFADADLMDPASWTKCDQPVFETSVENGVYAPGHNCFFTDAAGTDWLLYHANAFPGMGCGDLRTPRLQPIRWRFNGIPDFGVPAARGQLLQKPA